MTEVVWTPEQQAVIDYAQKWPRKRSELKTQPVPSLMVEAKAGSGKTYTLCKGFVPALPSYVRVWALAFNRDIAGDLKMAMPQGVECKTFSALGRAAWLGMVGKIDLQKNKTTELMKKTGVRWKDFPDCKRFIGLAKANGVDPGDVRTEPEFYFVENTFDTWKYMAEQNDLSLGKDGAITEQRAVEVLQSILATSSDLAMTGVIDFDDMLYMPALWGGDFPQADVVIVDEFQDVSNIQNTLIRRMLTSWGTLVAIGDRHQSIYAFRGADTEAIPRGIREFNCEVKDLTVSFRCGKRIIEEAQTFVPDITTLPDQHEGEVNDVECWSFEDVQVGDAILCRNNAPLVNICLKLIANKIPAQILGTEIATGLVHLIDSAETNSLLVLPDRLTNIEKKKTEEYLKNDQLGLVAKLKDQMQAIKYIIRAMEKDDTVQELIDHIKIMFSDGSPRVTLCTIHKSKGREWDRVFFLDSFLIPSRYAKTPEAIQQEHNLYYVGVTRAKQVLNFVETASFE